MDDENLSVHDETTWHHATLVFPSPRGLTGTAAAALLEALRDQRFHFLRKQGGLRLRTATPVGSSLDRLVAAGVLGQWTIGIYEPEVTAFGGAVGIEIAHDLFCNHSRAVLANACQDEAKPSLDREQAVLLITTMLRAAKLDRFEMGDVWDRVAAVRPAPEFPSGAQREEALAAMQRLINADATRLDGSAANWTEQVAAFSQTGHALLALAKAGRLNRGLRAILAHHAIFTLNRAGVRATHQAALAWLAKQTLFADGQPDSAPPRCTPMTDTTTDLAALHANLVQQLTASGVLHSPRIIAAFHTVQRHRFLSGRDLAKAYADETIATKSDERGAMLSAISQPTIVATQLEQLDVQPGHKVLEAGAATGYNAALLAHLAAPGGHVWTIDVDQDLVDDATKNLAAAGVHNATALLGDGGAGLPEEAPYDRIIFTVGAGDIPVKVLDQLTPAGRLVLPIRLRGSISRSIAFERSPTSNVWQSASNKMATFLPLRGVCGDPVAVTHFGGEGQLRIETYTEQEIALEVLPSLLDESATVVYTDVKFRKGSTWEWLYLWLACVLPNGLSRMPGNRPGFKPHFFWGSMATFDKDSLAYLTLQEGTDDEGLFWQIGVIGHGSRGSSLANQTANTIEEWARERPAPPSFRMVLAEHRSTLKPSDPRFIIDKPACRIAVDWT